MSIISISVFVVVVAFLAGLEGILDQFQFHQPLVACTLIGLVTGNSDCRCYAWWFLQMIALGWANIGAAAPDAALASVAAAIILVKGVTLLLKESLLQKQQLSHLCRSWTFLDNDRPYTLSWFSSHS